MSHNEAPQSNPNWLEEERVRLDAIQDEHAIELFNSGITTAALKTVPRIDPEKVVRVAVSVKPSEVEGETETGVMLYWVTEEIGGELFGESSYVPIAKCSSTSAGVTVNLEPGFTMDQFNVADDLAFELVNLREWRIIPDLSDDLLSINEPVRPVLTFENLDSDSF